MRMGSIASVLSCIKCRFIDKTFGETFIYLPARTYLNLGTDYGSSYTIFYKDSLNLFTVYVKMPPKSLNKVHKQMKKKGAKTNALHENSRDAKKLRRAGAREAKLARLVTATVKANQTYSEIKSFALVIADYDEEY